MARIPTQKEIFGFFVLTVILRFVIHHGYILTYEVSYSVGGEHVNRKHVAGGKQKLAYLDISSRLTLSEKNKNVYPNHQNKELSHLYSDKNDVAAEMYGNGEHRPQRSYKVDENHFVVYLSDGNRNFGKDNHRLKRNIQENNEPQGIFGDNSKIVPKAHSRDDSSNPSLKLNRNVNKPKEFDNSELLDTMIRNERGSEESKVNGDTNAQDDIKEVGVGELTGHDVKKQETGKKSMLSQKDYLDKGRPHNSNTYQKLEALLNNLTAEEYDDLLSRKVKTVKGGIEKSKEEFAETSEMCKVDFDCRPKYHVPFQVEVNETTYEAIKQFHPDVKQGGKWAPTKCKARERIAIIIPFKQRYQHLVVFIRNLIPFLKAQKKAFRIFVVEQVGDVIFNKAEMMNAGFIESQKFGTYNCFIFHDVDMLPLNLCNNYQCPSTNAIRHMGTSKDVKHPHLVFAECIGGASAFSKSTFKQINGFTNLMYGWGGEDDDGYWRVRKQGIQIYRYKTFIGNYYPLAHKKFSNFPRAGSRGVPVQINSNFRKYDGLNSVTYKVHDIKEEMFYTKIQVSVTGPRTVGEIKPLYLKHIIRLCKLSKTDCSNGIFESHRDIPKINLNFENLPNVGQKTNSSVKVARRASLPIYRGPDIVNVRGNNAQIAKQGLNMSVKT